MDDLKKYVQDRKKRDHQFSDGFTQGYRDFKIGAMLKQARLDAGLTQEELADLLQTKKTAISRIENHAQDIKLSTLEKAAAACGRFLEIRLA